MAALRTILLSVDRRHAEWSRERGDFALFSTYNVFKYDGTGSSAIPNEILEKIARVQAHERVVGARRSPIGEH